MTPLEIAVNALIDEGQSYQDVQNEFNCILTRRTWTDKKNANEARQEHEVALSAEAERIDAEKKAHIDELLRQQRDNL